MSQNYVFLGEKNQYNQQTNTYSKATVETSEKEVNMFRVNIKDTRTPAMTLFLFLYSLLRTLFTSFTGVSIAHFAHVFVNFERVCFWVYNINTQNFQKTFKA